MNIEDTKIVFMLLISIFISGCTNSDYHVTDDDVTFEIRSWSHKPIIKNVDIACSTTFENLGDGYGVDGHNVFYKGNVIQNADPETFDKFKWVYTKHANQ